MMGVIFGSSKAGGGGGSSSHTTVSIDDTDSTYTPLATNTTHICDTSAGVVDIDLSGISGLATGWVLSFKRSGSNAVTFDENIDGGSYTLQFDQASVTIVYDGTNWYSVT